MCLTVTGAAIALIAFRVPPRSGLAAVAAVITEETPIVGANAWQPSCNVAVATKKVTRADAGPLHLLRCTMVCAELCKGGGRCFRRSAVQRGETVVLRRLREVQTEPSLACTAVIFADRVGCVMSHIEKLRKSGF